VKAFETQISQLETNFQTQIADNVNKLDAQITQLQGSFQFIRHEKTEVTEIYLRTIQAHLARQGGLSVLDQMGVGTKDA